MNYNEAKKLAKNGKICDNCVHHIEFECMKHDYEIKIVSAKNENDIAYEPACKDWKKAPFDHRWNWFN